MLVVGLTGGISSGKTTVANLFAQYDVPLIDADIIARELTEPGQATLKVISQHIGEHILLPNGTLDRKALRLHIFTHPDERKWLENLLHPLIRDKIKQRVKILSVPYCLVIIPLLFEVAPYDFLDRIAVVDTPVELQIKRTMLRDKTTKEQVETMLNTQLKREERNLRADDIILNDGSMEGLTAQVEKLHQQYLRLSQQHN